MDVYRHISLITAPTNSYVSVPPQVKGIMLSATANGSATLYPFNPSGVTFAAVATILANTTQILPITIGGVSASNCSVYGLY